MNCKYCDALLEEGQTLCPECGKEQADEPETISCVDCTRESCDGCPLMATEETNTDVSEEDVSEDEAAEEPSEEEEDSCDCDSCESCSHKCKSHKDEDEDEEACDCEGRECEDRDCENCEREDCTCVCKDCTCEYCDDEEGDCRECDREDCDCRDQEYDPSRKKPKAWAIILAIVGCLALLCTLTLVLLSSMGIKIKFPTNDVYRKSSYLVDAEKAAASSDTVVATMGNQALTNGELQIFYWTQVYEFVNYCYQYYYYSPVDLYKPLSEQVMNPDTGMTWEQYFLEIAIETWQRYAALTNMAEAAGFKPSEKTTEFLKSLPEKMAEDAKKYGFESADAFIQADMGPAANIASYISYMEYYYVGLEYFDVLYKDTTATDQEIETYFTSHESELKQSGIIKDNGMKASVRHILIQPKTEDGDGEFSDKEWGAAQIEAERILELWKSGEMTEETFTALAKEYSEDPGVATNDGLYTDITSTASYLEEFRAWAVDAARKPGDTGIVKTSAGYHIMFYVSGEAGEPNWVTTCRKYVISDKISAAIENSISESNCKITFRKIVIGNAMADEIAERDAATAPSTGATVPSSQATTPSTEATTEATKETTDAAA